MEKEIAPTKEQILIAITTRYKEDLDFLDDINKISYSFIKKSKYENL